MDVQKSRKPKPKMNTRKGGVISDEERIRKIIAELSGAWRCDCENNEGEDLKGVRSDGKSCCKIKGKRKVG
jgi:hypothetical protein